jgi:hypothetical protein
MKTGSQVLMEARALIENPTRWTQGELARDEQGRPVNCLSSRAVRWCAAGAIYRVAGGSDAVNKAFGLLAKVCQDIPQVNDTQGLKVVLEIFERAIKK